MTGIPDNSPSIGNEDRRRLSLQHLAAQHPICLSPETFVRQQLQQPGAFAKQNVQSDEFTRYSCQISGFQRYALIVSERDQSYYSCVPKEEGSGGYLIQANSIDDAKARIANHYLEVQGLG